MLHKCVSKLIVMQDDFICSIPAVIWKQCKDDLIDDVQIDAKHSFEDTINIVSPVVEKYLV